MCAQDWCFKWAIDYTKGKKVCSDVKTFQVLWMDPRLVKCFPALCLFEWKWLYHLFRGGFNEPVMLSHKENLYFIGCTGCQFIFIWSSICGVAWGSIRSNKLAVVHSDDNKSRHYHFYWKCVGGIFVRWKNNLWSLYVLLRTLENNNTVKAHERLKGAECYKSDGICIFCLARSRERRKGGGGGEQNHKIKEVHVRMDMFLHKSCDERFVDFKVKAFISRQVFCLWTNKIIIDQIINRNIWTLLPVLCVFLVYLFFFF